MSFIDVIPTINEQNTRGTISILIKLMNRVPIGFKTSALSTKIAPTATPATIPITICFHRLNPDEPLFVVVFDMFIPCPKKSFYIVIYPSILRLLGYLGRNPLLTVASSKCEPNSI